MQVPIGGSTAAANHHAECPREDASRTLVTYELTAQPTFDVPEFLLKRVLKRDAAEMIERLQREIAAREPLHSS